MKKHAPKIARKLSYVFASVLILIALLVSIARLLTPVLNQHRAEFERFASNILEMPVIIGEVSVSWHGYSPEISFARVTILDPVKLKPKVQMQRLDIDFSLWRSLKSKSIFVENVTVAGVNLTVTQATTGMLRIGDLTALNIKDSLTGASVQTDQVFRWIFSQPHLALENIQVRYIYDDHPDRLVNLRILSLQNTPTHHVMEGRGTLQQTIPTKLSVHLAWEGDIRKLPEAKANIYLYFQGLSFSQWFSKATWQGWQAQNGLGDVKIWANWEKNQLQKLQSTFTIDDLKVYSPLKKQTEVIKRVKANIGWSFANNIHTLAGDQLEILFSDHAWPKSAFSMQFSQDELSNYLLHELVVTYANLNDIQRVLLATPLLTEELQNQIVALKLRGELMDFSIKPTQPLLLNKLTLDVLPTLQVTGKFNHLTFQTLGSYPGLQNVSGHLDWDGKLGNIAIDSKHTGITIQQLFAKPLFFDNFNSTMQIHRDAENNWMFTTKKTHADNADLTADVAFSLLLATQGNSKSNIDLEGNFTVNNAAHIANYLPVQTYSADLKEWLQKSFISGRGTEGKAIVKGNLEDFPFDNNTGKFSISFQVQDLNLRYAEGWPAITHAQGKVEFLGSAVNIFISKAQTLDIPLQNVKGTIPSLSSNGPVELKLETAIQTDLSKAQNFINHSPLHKNLGKDLSVMQLSGPLQMQLGINVPLETPDQTQVSGQAKIVNAKADMPALKLALENVRGDFQFTEKSLDSTQLAANLFNTPVALNFVTTTLADNSNQIKVNLNGQITVANLEDWLNTSLSNVAQGTTRFNGELLINLNSKTNQNQFVLTTDLAGVAIDAPVPFKKAANAKTRLIVEIPIESNDTVKVKARYENLLTAALNFKKSDNNTVILTGGEIRLGKGDANFQTQPGLWLTGQTKELNIDTWQTYFDLLKNKNATKKFDMRMIRGADVNADEIIARGLRLRRAHVKASPQKNAWNIDVTSNELAGQIILPFTLTNQTIVGRLQRLYVTQKSEGQKVDPKVLPALSFDIEEVRYQDSSLGHVIIDAVPAQNGMLIREWRIEENSLLVTGSGTWFGTKDKSETHLKGRALSQDIGGALIARGFKSPNFQATDASVNFELNWNGAPYEITLGSLNGTLSLMIGKGRILQLSEQSSAQVGLGKLLNVFSLSSLPRRLSLDFSDLFDKGFTFDSIVGSFTLRNGNAYTNDMRLESSLAKIRITGRIGLKNKDLDVKINVAAHVTGSLPVVAAVMAGPAAPMVGAAALVAEKMISNQVSNAMATQYQVTGSWANPNWQKTSGSRGGPGESSR